MSRSGEISYLNCVDNDELSWIRTKPFGRKYDTPRLLEDFARILRILRLEGFEKCQLLEIGCCTGWLSDFLARMGYKMVGIDICIDAVFLRQKEKGFNPKGAAFIGGDWECLPFQAGSFDGVLVYDALHHAEDRGKVVAEVGRILRPGGLFMAFEPNQEHTTSPKAIAASHKYGTTEIGIDWRAMKNALAAAGFTQFRRLYCPAFEVKRTLLRQMAHLLSKPIIDIFLRWRHQFPVHWVARKN